MDMVESPTNLTQVAEQGVALCRRGRWEEGLELLGRVTESTRVPQLPGLFYAWLGYGIARFEKRYREGLSLCEYAVKVDVCEPEAYLNLARVQLLLGKRSRALGVLNRGLALAPESSALTTMRADLGVRRAPVISFLDRSNPLNRWLGQWRHRARQASG